MRLLVIGLLALVPALAAAADGGRAKPLPGNKPCPYPPEAQKQYVAGPVSFVARVRPDGSTESVEVRQVPLPALGFEDAVRACVSEWRFEPAPAGDVASRSYEGLVRYRLDTGAEASIRALMETLAAAWSDDDMKAVDDLAWRGDDGPVDPPPAQLRLSAQLASWPAPQAPWRMALEPEWEHVRFIRPDLAGVRQPLQRIVTRDTNDQAAGEAPLLDALIGKGPRGWRFVRATVVSRAWLGAVRFNPDRGDIREPRKLKAVPPRYPDAAKESRIQGVVVLDCIITAAGKVTSVRLLRGVHKLVDDAAIEAVRQWEYAPTLLDGEAVPVIMTVTVSFRLN